MILLNYLKIHKDLQSGRITTVDASNIKQKYKQIAKEDRQQAKALLGQQITGNVAGAVGAGTCAFESSGANKTLKNTPVAIAGSNYDVESGDNLFVDAWVIGVVNTATAPAVSDAHKQALKTIAYV